MKISNLDPEQFFLGMGEYVYMAFSSLIAGKDFHNYLYSSNSRGKSKSYKLEFNGSTLFLSTDGIRKSTLSTSMPDPYIMIFSTQVFIDGVSYPRMSTLEFEQDLFSLSTIYSTDLLEKLYVSTFCTDILLYGEYSLTFNYLMVHNYLERGGELGFV